MLCPRFEDAMFCILEQRAGEGPGSGWIDQDSDGRVFLGGRAPGRSLADIRCTPGDAWGRGYE